MTMPPAIPAYDEMGYTPGDVRYNGDILVLQPCGWRPTWTNRGVILVTPEQARRAEVLGWTIDHGPVRDRPDLVMVVRL